MIGYWTLILALLLSHLLRKSAQWNLQKTEWIENVDDKEDDDVSDSAQKVQAVLSRSANLPCDTENIEGEDRVYMVLWFKKNVEKPIYSFDVRGRPFQKALHWSDENFFGPRAYFVTTKKPTSLQVDNVQLQDEGIYRCRVDFKNAPTKNLQIELTVIVPPHQILLYDFSGREIEGNIGPLYEGSNLTVTCEVRGGKPKPKLLWISSKAENVLEENVRKTVNGNIAISKLEQQNLSRSHANVKYTCVSTNTNLTSPVTKSVRLQLYLRPLYVKIVDKPIQLTANKVYKLTCISAGSEPVANLTWYKNDSIINDTELKHNSIVDYSGKSAEETGRISRSINFIPKPEDNGHTIKCHAVNPKIDGFLLEDSFKLNVHYSPIVDLRLGSNLKVDNIKEGDDVYFECKTRSNPPEQKIEWYHNGQKINQKTTSKSRYNLVLQLINRLNSGYYTCAVSNNIGETISRAIDLRVKYAPICTNKSPYIIGANLGETVQAQCSVFADPKDITFIWIFNSSAQSFPVPENKYQLINSTTSKITYNIASEKDYGTLACITKNGIGKQIEPCMFRVIAAAYPASPYNCSVEKVINGSTTEILEVYCSIDINEELPQTYHLEVIDDLKVINNITSFEYPIFRVNLSPYITTGKKSNLEFIVYSSNSKGISDRILLKYNTLNNSQQNAEFTMEKDYQSHKDNVFLLAFTTVVGITTIFSGLLLITVLLIRKRRKRNENSIPFIDNRTIKKVDLKAENEQHKYILSYELQINKSQPDILHKVDKAENNEIKTEDISSRSSELSYRTNNHCTNAMSESDFQDRSLCKSQLNSNKCKKMNIYQNFQGSSETVLESSIFGPESRV